jgi:hypothetical protein
VYVWAGLRNRRTEMRDQLGHFMVTLDRRGEHIFQFWVTLGMGASHLKFFFPKHVRVSIHITYDFLDGSMGFLSSVHTSEIAVQTILLESEDKGRTIGEGD